MLENRRYVFIKFVFYVVEKMSADLHIPFYVYYESQLIYTFPFMW